MGEVIRGHRDVLVYQKAMASAMAIFELSRHFPPEERHSLTDQIRRSSRSVCANFAEAWRKRRYERAFVSKLADTEGEAAETQTWIEFAVKCGYLNREVALPLYHAYDEILSMLVAMITSSEKWTRGLQKDLSETPVPYDPFEP
jgi:four helix bundle protein